LHKRHNNQALSNIEDNEMIKNNEIRKSLKSDMQMSHQDIAFQSPTSAKK
jgi:hypothetical protein